MRGRGRYAPSDDGSELNSAYSGRPAGGRRPQTMWHNAVARTGGADEERVPLNSGLQSDEQQYSESEYSESYDSRSGDPRYRRSASRNSRGGGYSQDDSQSQYSEGYSDYSRGGGYNSSGSQMRSQYSINRRGDEDHWSSGGEEEGGDGRSAVGGSEYSQGGGEGGSSRRRKEDPRAPARRAKEREEKHHPAMERHMSEQRRRTSRIRDAHEEAEKKKKRRKRKGEASTVALSAFASAGKKKDKKRTPKKEGEKEGEGAEGAAEGEGAPKKPPPAAMKKLLTLSKATNAMKSKAKDTGTGLKDAAAMAINDPKKFAANSVSTFSRLSRTFGHYSALIIAPNPMVAHKEYKKKLARKRWKEAIKMVMKDGAFERLQNKARGLEGGGAGRLAALIKMQTELADDPDKQELVRRLEKKRRKEYDSVADRLVNEAALSGQMLFDWFTPNKIGDHKVIWTWSFLTIEVTIFFFMAGESQLFRASMYADYDVPYASEVWWNWNDFYGTGPPELRRWIFEESALPKWHFMFPYLHLWGGRYSPAIKDGEWWRWFTSMFVHRDFNHIFANMLLFVTLSSHLEHKYGTTVVMALFLMSGVGGNLISVMWEGGCTMVVGASGTCFGLFGLFIADMVLNFETIERPLIRIIIICVFMIFFLIQILTEEGTSHMSHVGGMFCGLFPSFLVLPNCNAEKWEMVLPFLGVGTVILVFLVVPVWVYFQTLPKIDCSAYDKPDSLVDNPHLLSYCDYAMFCYNRTMWTPPPAPPTPPPSPLPPAPPFAPPSNLFDPNAGFGRRRRSLLGMGPGLRGGEDATDAGSWKGGGGGGGGGGGRAGGGARGGGGGSVGGGGGPWDESRWPKVVAAGVGSAVGGLLEAAAVGLGLAPFSASRFATPPPEAFLGAWGPGCECGPGAF